MAKQRLRDIVIVIPGITGSVLQKDKTDLWAISGRAVWNSLRSLGGSLDDLRLDGDDPESDDLGDGIVATRTMPSAHLVPGLWKIDGYSETVRMVTDNFQVVTGSLADVYPANFFEFPYDWRRDTRVAARKLGALIDQRLPLWRKSSGVADARVILIAHSMGGLVARHYLEVLNGWPTCRALITFGTPYRGSLNALNYLVNGYKELFLDLTEVMRSFTSTYQLLPIYEAVRVGGNFVRVGETRAIPNVVRERAADALEFHRRIEAAVEEHRSDATYLKSGYKILPIVGTRQPTLQSATLEGETLIVHREVPDCVDEQLGDGDGTVPRVSAIPIELSDEYRDTFVPERHGSLQNNRHVLSDVIGRLQQMQARGVKAVRGPEVSVDAETRPGLSIDLDDLYLPHEPIEIRARLVNVGNDAGAVRALLEPVDGTRAAARHELFVREGEEWVLRITGLPSGLYRGTFDTLDPRGSAPPPVADLFEIAGDD